MIFYKYHGAGNDFVLIDNRALNLELSASQISFICERHFGVGADGFIAIENHADGDFYMKYYNSDGRLSTMCGNGGRCAVKFAKQIGVFEGDSTKFFAADGVHFASLLEEDQVALQMNFNPDYSISGNGFIIDTGSPHFVRFTYNVDSLDVNKEGKIVRNSAQFKKEGINVNFVEETSNGMFVRTYERGVEGETLSCGTGVTAASLAYFFKEKLNSSTVVDVETLGGKLSVQIEVDDYNKIKLLWLIGPAQEVYLGEIDI